MSLGSPTLPSLATLKPDHPRLFVTSSDIWARLNADRGRDAALHSLLTLIESEATALLDTPVVERVMVGKRLLHTSREAMRRISVLAVTYRLGGDPRYLQRADAELRAVCGFADWNPAHFLDVGEMALAVALGYDWLHDALPETTRTLAREALRDKALRPAVADAGHNWWRTSRINWNSVCFGGVVSAALAVGDAYPDLAADVLRLCFEGNPRALQAYEPQGVHPEGPAYWVYGTTYQAILFDALDSALGEGVSRPMMTDSFIRTGDYFQQMRGPTDEYFGYSDFFEVQSTEVLLWFARLTDQPALAKPDAKAEVAGGFTNGQSGYMAFAAVWWPDAASTAEAQRDSDAALPLAWHGKGEQPLVVFRETWGDEDALFLAAKGGRADLTHGHMDAGSFVLEADGVRWAIELGAERYQQIESHGLNLFDPKQDSDRWRVYRLGNTTHNTLTLQGKPHRVDGQATVERFDDRPGHWSAVMNLSEVFKPDATSVWRGFRVEPTAGVMVQDEVAGLRVGGEVCWTMVTRAAVVIEGEGRSATLRQDGKHLRVVVLEPAGAVLSVAAADPPAEDTFNSPNPGTFLLTVRARVDRDDAKPLTMKVVLLRGDAELPASWRTASALSDWGRE